MDAWKKLGIKAKLFVTGSATQEEMNYLKEEDSQWFNEHQAKVKAKIFCCACEKEVIGKKFYFADQLKEHYMMCETCMKQTGFQSIVDYRENNNVSFLLSLNYVDADAYVKYKNELLNQLGRIHSAVEEKHAVWINNVIVNKDFVMNANYPDVLIKSDDVWAILIIDPVEDIIKDAVYKVVLLTSLRAIPYISFNFIINTDNNIALQAERLNRAVLSNFRNLKYNGRNWDEMKNMIDRSEKSYASENEWMAVREQILHAYGTFDEQRYKGNESGIQQSKDFIASLGYQLHILPQERKTTNKDELKFVVKKSASSVLKVANFTASTIGVVTGTTSLDEAVYDWERTYDKK